MQAIVIKANDLLGNDGGLSAAALGASLKATQREMKERAAIAKASQAMERHVVINNQGDTVDATRWDYS